MPRPFCCRRIAGKPTATIFHPVGIPCHELEEIVISLDEFEAIRLADLNDLYQEQAAQQMKVSRPTFSRIVESAHKKIADAVVHGKAFRIDGGPVRIESKRCCRLHDKKMECPKQRLKSQNGQEKTFTSGEKNHDKRNEDQSIK